MKQVIMTSLIVLSSVISFAADKNLPAECTTIASQCEAAGFMPGAHKKNGKGLWVDCVHVVAKGQTVTGVTATKDDAIACQKAKHAQGKPGTK